MRLKRGILLILTLLICTACISTAYAQEAQELTGRCAVVLSGGKGSVADLTDHDYTTQWKAPKSGGTLTVQAPEGIPLSGIYLLWDKLPKTLYFSVDSGDGWMDYPVTDHRLLHQYVDLPDVRGIKLESREEPMILNELRLYGPGDLPKDVQRWNPPCEKADLLLIPTHPDDEDLFFGGTLPTYAGQYGKNVQVVYMTQATRRRRHEALDGLWLVGVRHAPVFSPFEDMYCDSLSEAEQAYHVPEVTGWQVEMIRRFKPLAIIGHDIEGEYGHSVHKLNARCLQKAVEQAGKDGFYPASQKQYGLWDTPKCYLHNWPENQRLMDWDKPLSFFGGKTGYEMAGEAFRCHLSQQNGHHAMSKEGRRDCRNFGLYRSLVGPDVMLDDFLEHTDEALAAFQAAPSSAAASLIPQAPEAIPEPADNPGEVSAARWPVAVGASLIALALLLAIGLMRKALLRARRSSRPRQ